MARRRPWLAAWLAATLFATSLAEAARPEEEVARHAFEDGVALEKQGDYSAALKKFRESAEIKATVGNRFHLAYCLEMTGKLALALVEYEGVEKAAREQGKGDVLAETRGRLDPLAARIPRLTLRMAPSAPSGAIVVLDGTPVAQDVLGGPAIRVDPGEHTLTCEAEDHERWVKRISLPDASSTTVEISLVRKSASSEAANVRALEPPPPPAKAKIPVAAIVTAGVAVVLAGGGVVSYVVADREDRDARRICPTRLSCSSERDRVRTYDTLALVGLVGGVGLGVVSVVLFASKPASSHGGASARVDVGPTWLGMGGRF